MIETAFFLCPEHSPTIAPAFIFESYIDGFLLDSSVAADKLQNQHDKSYHKENVDQIPDSRSGEAKSECPENQEY